MRYFKKLSSSARELKDLRALVIVSLMIALNVVLSYFTFYITQTLRISFAFIPLAAASAMFGPVAGGIAGALGDILSYITSQSVGGAYFPGFTVNAFVTCFIYGIFLYNERITLVRVFAAKLVQALTVELLLTPLWLSVMYGDAFYVLLAARWIKTLVFIPFETLIVFLIAGKSLVLVKQKNK